MIFRSPDGTAAAELRAEVNALLRHHLFRWGGKPRPLRVFSVAVDGETVRLTLRALPSAVERKIRRTPRGIAAIAAWEGELLVALTPGLRRVVEECLGWPLGPSFRITRNTGGRPVLVLEFAASRRGHAHGGAVH